ncbi:AI-2E family transporter [Dankookia sp. GCM10030260]|uniref:AI-2E family transporter n=1 Tax=Dankookia sp. GCM10030260 TaxID=3273390 RepID=UPI003615F6F7
MPEAPSVRDRLLGLIVSLLVIAGLRWSYPVSMPLAGAIFIVAVIWPVKQWLDRVLPAALSYLLAGMLLLLVLLGFFGAVYFSASQVVQSFVDRQEEFRSLYDTFLASLRRHGLPTPLEQDGFARLVGLAQAALSRLYTVLGYLGFIAILVLLGLPEVPAFRRKLHHGVSDSDRQDVLDTAERIASVFRSYLGVTVLVSLFTGLASMAWALAIGLDLAVTWGLLNFLLNFVPVFGNIIGIILPTLYALIQFQDWTMLLVTFLGYTVLQVAVSNFVYPWMQGERLSLSPAAIVVALAFWSWVWGIAGALLAVPLTAAVAIVCGRFSSTEWIARMLSKG